MARTLSNRPHADQPGQQIRSRDPNRLCDYCGQVRVANLLPGARAARVIDGYRSDELADSEDILRRELVVLPVLVALCFGTRYRLAPYQALRHHSPRGASPTTNSIRQGYIRVIVYTFRHIRCETKDEAA